MKIFIITLCLLSSCQTLLYAQKLPDLKFADMLQKASGKKQQQLPLLKKDQVSNEFETLLASLFWGYKNLLSSQDANQCTFTPSCSSYAMLTIKKHGFVEGYLDTVDRLTRCNGISPENYEIDLFLNLLVDFP